MTEQIPGRIEQRDGKWRLAWRTADRKMHSFTAVNLGLVLAYAREHGILAQFPQVRSAAPDVELRPEPPTSEKIVPDGPTDMRFSG